MFCDSSPTWVIVNQIRDGIVSKDKEAWLINAAYLNITAIVPTAETAKRADYSTEELVFKLQFNSVTQEERDCRFVLFQIRNTLRI